MSQIEAEAALANMTVYGLDLSYFTGKLQAYLRYCELPFNYRELDSRTLRQVARATGMAQMPAIQMADGRWMTDTTAIIGWIEKVRRGPEVTPRDPALGFLSLLLEDYADEWLWRPALHYRWSYRADTDLMGGRIATELLRDVPGPLALRKAFVIKRQQDKYVRGDGVTAANRAHVEDTYRRNLTWLQAILQDRPFLLGNRPSLVDFGFMGPMFRHFSIDPTPAGIMRDEAPAVYEWVARVWNARASLLGERSLLQTAPQDWSPFLRDAGLGHLPCLAANAAAAQAGQSSFDITLEGFAYRLPVNLNRVHGLKALQSAYHALPPAAAEQVQKRLEADGAWEPLWQTLAPDAGFDPEGRLPFLTAQTAWARGKAPRRRPVHDGAAR
jgi:glutathione S-transferase